MDTRKSGSRILRLPGRGDQLVVALGLTVFMLLMGFYFWHRAIVNGGLIEFEDMPIRPAAYLVDINSANWQELANLPGLGEKLSREIVSYRDLNGPFDTADELMAVHGIGKAKFQALRPFIATFSTNTGTVNRKP